MSEPTLPTTRLFDSAGEAVEDYRALSASAVIALLLGLASPLALLSSLFWFVPCVGIAVALFAFGRIAQCSPTLFGRGAARCGLWISVMFLAAVPAESYCHRWLVQEEGKRFASVWFEALARGDILVAHQLTLDSRARRPFDPQLPEFYHENVRPHKELESYSKEPVVRALVALGKKASVRYYSAEPGTRNENDDYLSPIYAVTYDDPANGRTTFFVSIILKRVESERGHANWQVYQVNGGVHPEGW